MPMGPRIRSHRILFDVCADGVRREMQQDTARALTACTVVDQLKSRNVRDEVRIPRAVTFNDSAFAAEISFFATETIAKSKRVVKNEIQITKPINHHRRIRQGDKSRRLISLNVEMLAPGVERWGEHTAFLPFERLLRAAFGPNAGRTPSLDQR